MTKHNGRRTTLGRWLARLTLWLAIVVIAFSAVGCGPRDQIARARGDFHAVELTTHAVISTALRALTRALRGDCRSKGYEMLNFADEVSLDQMNLLNGKPQFKSWKPLQVQRMRDAT